MNKSEAHNTAPPPNTAAYVQTYRVAVGDRIRLTRAVGTRAAGDEGTVTQLPTHWACAVEFDVSPPSDRFALRESEFEVIPNGA